MAYINRPDKPAKLDKFKPKVGWMQNCEWDSESKQMTITFGNGSQYVYQNVSAPTWASFKESPDHGTYYSRAIKGRISSVAIKRQPIGQPHKTPLKQASKPRRTNTNGLNIGNASKRPTRAVGTVPSAFGR